MDGSNATTPRDLGPNAEGTALRVVWKDGHVSEYLPRYLRLACPCAGCVDEMTGERILSPGMVPEDVHPHSIQYVGRYALQFFWSDGHSTGYYTFEYLRRLCPCAECADGAAPEASEGS